MIHCIAVAHNIYNLNETFDYAFTACALETHKNLMTRFHTMNSQIKTHINSKWCFENTRTKTSKQTNKRVSEFP